MTTGHYFVTVKPYVSKKNPSFTLKNPKEIIVTNNKITLSTVESTRSSVSCRHRYLNFKTSYRHCSGHIYCDQLNRPRLRRPGSYLPSQILCYRNHFDLKTLSLNFWPFLHFPYKSLKIIMSVTSYLFPFYKSYVSFLQ